MGGIPTIREPRIPVATVVSMVADGMTVEDICGPFPLAVLTILTIGQHTPSLCPPDPQGIPTRLHSVVMADELTAAGR
jgi:uncharacterized protein DUF433